MARMRPAPRWIAGERGAVSWMPPSPYQAFPTCTAGKKRGSAAEAMTWSTVSSALTLLRCARSQTVSPVLSTHVIDWPVV
jgi:hypothetical protein